MMPQHSITRRQRGSYMVETAIAFPIFLGLVFLLMDVSWTLFVKGTLQHAVREGVRYAVTGRTSGQLGQASSITQVVRQHARGLLDSQAGLVHVRFFRPDNQAATASNIGGNVVVVSVEGYSLSPLLPFLHKGAPILLTVHSGDRLESSPPGGPPAI